MSLTWILSFFVVYQLKHSRLRQRPGTAERNFPTNSSGLLRNEKNSWIFLLLSLISCFWDAFFFYIPVIYDDSKCLVLVKRPAIVISVLRSICDLLQVYAIYKTFTAVSDPSLISGTGYFHEYYWWANAWKYFRLFLDILSIFPVPQILILMIVPEIIRDLDYTKAVNLLKYSILLQYFPRSSRIYLLYSKAKRSPSIFDTAITLAKAAFYLFVCGIIVHAFGALWYFMAIERLTVCWTQAYPKNGAFCCNVCFAEHQMLNDFCPTKTRDPTVFDFGVFHDALQLRLVEVKNFPQKLLYGLRWSLNIHSYGQNSTSSIYAWESFFLILVWISGTLLIPYLAGNVLAYLHHYFTESEEIGSQMLEIEQWAPFPMLSNGLQQQVRNYCQTVWQETRGVNVEHFLSDLPRDISRHIKLELCLPALVKVPMFEKMDEQFLHAMLDLLKMVRYSEESILIQEGNQVTEMLYIIKGNVSTTNRRETCFFWPTNHDNFCGEELLPWALNRQHCHLPLSTRTVKAVTLIEAFSFNAKDLKEVVDKFWLPDNQLPNNFRYYSEEWRNLAVGIIKAAWFCRQMRSHQDAEAGFVSNYATRFAINTICNIRHALRVFLRQGYRNVLVPPQTSH